MKLKVVLDDDRNADLMPELVWHQIKRAISNLGQAYGVHIEFPGDVATTDALGERWREAVGRFRGE